MPEPIRSERDARPATTKRSRHNLIPSSHPGTSITTVPTLTLIYSFLLAAGSKARYHVWYDLAFIIMVLKLTAEGIKVCWDCVLQVVSRLAGRPSRLAGRPLNVHNLALRAATELRIELPASLQHA